MKRSGVIKSPKTKYPKNPIIINKTHSKITEILAIFLVLLKDGNNNSFLKLKTNGYT